MTWQITILIHFSAMEILLFFFSFFLPSWSLSLFSKLMIDNFHVYNSICQISWRSNNYKNVFCQYIMSTFLSTFGHCRLGLDDCSDGTWQTKLELQNELAEDCVGVKGKEKHNSHTIWSTLRQGFGWWTVIWSIL